MAAAPLLAGAVVAVGVLVTWLADDATCGVVAGVEAGVVPEPEVPAVELEEPGGGSTEMLLPPVSAGGGVTVALASVPVAPGAVAPGAVAAVPEVPVAPGAVAPGAVAGEVVVAGALTAGWLPLGVVVVRFPWPIGKNEPPEIRVAMIPAITATSAIPISRSGQLRRSQSMFPIIQRLVHSERQSRGQALRGSW